MVIGLLLELALETISIRPAQSEIPQVMVAHGTVWVATLMNVVIMMVLDQMVPSLQLMSAVHVVLQL